MREVFNILIILLFIAGGCETDKSTTGNEITDGFSIKIGTDFIVGPEDIDYYDFSTHFIYLQDGITIPSKYEGGASFAVFAGTEEIYTGLIVPGYSCYMPSGPIIHSQPYYYPDFIIAIDFIEIFDSSGNYDSDPRGDERIVAALKKYDQFHEGLSGKIGSIQCPDDHSVTLNLELQNNDTFNYYYLDPDKMGPALFNYFTNGLYLWDAERKIIYESVIESTRPDPWNSWKKEWLTQISRGETKYLSLTYEHFDQVPPGRYQATFEYPGLSYQVSKEDIVQDHGRIWLGSITLKKEITVE